MKIGKNRKLTLLGTQNWRSYALLRAGVRLESDGKRDAAERLYIKALKLDPANRGARVNLATLLIEEDENERAVEHLQQAKREAEAEGGIRDAVFYSAKYRLALALYNLGRHAEAEHEADDLLKHVQVTIGQLKHTREKSPELASYLESIEPVATLLLFGLRVVLGKFKDDSNLRIDSTIPDHQVQYNLACTYSLLLEKNQAADSKSTKLGQKALSYLDFALHLNRQPINWILKDPSLKEIRERDPFKTEFIRLTKKYSSPPKPRIPNVQPFIVQD